MPVQEYYLKGGQKRYRVKGRLGTDPITGQSKFINRQGFKTRQEAESAYNKYRFEFDTRTMEPTTNITYQEMYDRWILYYKESVKESTFQKTLTIFKNHVLPRFGHLRIRMISPIHCQDFINEIMATHRNGKSYFGYATMVMDYAKKLGLLRVNPFENVIYPKKKKASQKVDFLTRDEVKLLLKTMNDNLMHYAYFRLLIFTGLRKCEALGLTWSDIDFFRKELTVNKTLALGIDNVKTIQEPKTGESRTLVLDPDTVIALEKLKRFKSSVIVFSNAEGDYYHPNRPGRWLGRYLKRAGMRHIRVHDLRHTHASLLFESGADIKAVQERLGHRDVSTTMNIYTHLTEKKEKETVLNFVDYIG